MELDELTMGNRVAVVPQQQQPGGNWIAECDSLPADWICEIRPRRDYEIRSGVPIETWILEADHQRLRLVVSGSDFGFKPISDRMRPRYVEALQHVVSALHSGALHEQDTDYFSEVKGMFSRCMRQDQWDWYAVYMALGRPTRERAAFYSARLDEVSRSLKRSDDVEAEVLLSRLDDGEFQQVISRASRAISGGSPALSAPLSGERAQQTKVADRRARSTMSDGQKSALARATATHEETLGILGAHLADSGHQVESNKFVDAFCRLKSGPALFEVKSITEENALHQVRAALAQLYEYRFRHQLHGASLWIVLSEPLTVDAWLVDYLETDRDVRVLWIVDGTLAGPSIARLLESGSAALRRGRSSQD